jgi:hypothetical protein
MGANVFISFASKDQKVAATLCSAIEKRGYSCWISSRDIEPGDNFQSAIVSAIIASKVMLLVFTANSNSSDEMTKELALASQQKLIVVPLRVEDVAPNAAFSYEFATRQWIDLFVDWEKAIDQLCERLRRAMPPETPPPVVGAPAAQPSFVAAPQAAAAPKTPVGLLIGVALAAVLAVGALIALPILLAKKPAPQQAAAPAAAPLAASAPASTPAAPVGASAPVVSATPAVAAAPATPEAASAPTDQAATHHPRRAELAAARTARTSENTHSDAYICAHGDDADYHTTQACDRKDRAGDGN